MQDVRTSSRVTPQIVVRLRAVSKAFPADPSPVTAVQDMSFDVAKGEFAAILGPSGCGKSTVIRIVAGLTQPTSGTVSVNAAPVARAGRDCSMVFQGYTSFPWLTVIENIAFGLRYTMRGNRAAQLDTARHFAQMVGLERFQDFHINRLSGGMKQRVAIASALATDPEILLMDEPFGALDSQTRMVMQEQLTTIVEKANKTVMFVTHDIEEALLLGDRVYVCSALPAKILAEFDVPFDRPRSAATRNDPRFFSMKHEIFNLLRDHVHAESVQAAYQRWEQKRG